MEAFAFMTRTGSDLPTQEKNRAIPGLKAMKIDGIIHAHLKFRV
jgi:hypothetical protein